MLKHRDLGLTKDEQIIIQCKHHWSLFILPALGLGLSIALGWLPEGLRLIAPIFALLALIALAGAGHRLLTSTIILTNRRIIYLQGYFFHSATDLYLPRVEGVRIHQKPLAESFSVGALTLLLSGGDRYHFSHIAKPKQFRARLLALRVPRKPLTNAKQAIVAKAAKPADLVSVSEQRSS